MRSCSAGREICGVLIRNKGLARWSERPPHSLDFSITTTSSAVFCAAGATRKTDTILSAADRHTRLQSQHLASPPTQLAAGHFCYSPQPQQDSYFFQLSTLRFILCMHSFLSRVVTGSLFAVHKLSWSLSGSLHIQNTLFFPHSGLSIPRHWLSLW